MIDYEKSERLEVRCSPFTKELIIEAARICDATISSFLLNAAISVAHHTIEQNKRIMDIIRGDYD
jgi:uncharacterized protein (DUF1778 family)